MRKSNPMLRATRERMSPEFCLIGVALLWGLTFPIIRVAVRDIDPFYFVFIRFTLASLAFIPFLIRSPELRSEVRRLFWVGFGLGAIAWITYITQPLGLKTVSCPRAAFITVSYVLLVPLLSPLLRVGKPTRGDWWGALVATVGLYWLLNPKGEGISMGDLWIFICALFMALHIVIVQKVTRANQSAVAITFLQLFAIAFCSGIALPIARPPMPHWSLIAVGGTLICAWIVSVGSFLIQATYQNRTTPERASLIFALEPLFASVFGYVLLGEHLSGRSAVGALLLLCAPLLLELAKRRQARGQWRLSRPPTPEGELFVPELSTQAPSVSGLLGSETKGI